MFYWWRWVYKNGQKEIKQLSTNLVVHGAQIQQIEISKSTRMLGVYMTLTLS